MEEQTLYQREQAQKQRKAYRSLAIWMGIILQSLLMFGEHLSSNPVPLQLFENGIGLLLIVFAVGVALHLFLEKNEVLSKDETIKLLVKMLFFTQGIVFLLGSLLLFVWR